MEYCYPRSGAAAPDDLPSSGFGASLMAYTKRLLEKYFLTDDGFKAEYGQFPQTARQLDFRSLVAQQEKPSTNPLDIIEAKLITFDRLKFLGVKDIFGQGSKCTFAGTLHEYIRSELDNSFRSFLRVKAELDLMNISHLTSHLTEVKDVLSKASNTWGLFMILLSNYHHMRSFISNFDHVQRVFENFTRKCEQICESINDDSHAKNAMELEAITYYIDVSFPNKLKRLSKLEKKNHKVRFLPFEGNGGSKVPISTVSASEPVLKTTATSMKAKVDTEKVLIMDSAAKNVMSSNEGKEAEEENIREPHQMQEIEDAKVNHIPTTFEEKAQEANVKYTTTSTSAKPEPLPVEVDSCENEPNKDDDAVIEIEVDIPDTPISPVFERRETNNNVRASTPSYSSRQPAEEPGAVKPKQEVQNEDDDMERYSFEFEEIADHDDNHHRPSQEDIELAANFYSTYDVSNQVVARGSKGSVREEGKTTQDEEDKELLSKSAPKNTRMGITPLEHDDVEDII